MSSPLTRPPSRKGLSSDSPVSQVVTIADPSRLSRARLLRRGVVASLALGAWGVFADRGRGATKARKPPQLPPGFTKTFTSRFIKAGGLRQHAVIGGDGPPLLLVHGWPETWYAWRLLMPALAQDFTVIAVDQRGIGLTEKPQTGYDSATLANDLVALMHGLGHDRFAMVGHDTGVIISYALAADHPQLVDRVAVAEVPGPPLPEVPPLFVPEPLNNRLWHLPFNRVDAVPEQLVRGREDIFFGYEFAIQSGDGTKLDKDTVDYYVQLLSDHDALRGSFALYRELDATLTQNVQRRSVPLRMPVLAIGGATSWGEQVGIAMKALANDVQSVVIPGTGHWVAETAPKEMLAALTAFLAPYLKASAERNAVAADSRGLR